MFSIALIGCGRISFKHVEAYADNKDTIEMITTCDSVLEKAEKNCRLCKSL